MLAQFSSKNNFRKIPNFKIQNFEFLKYCRLSEIEYRFSYKILNGHEKNIKKCNHIIEFENILSIFSFENTFVIKYFISK